MASENITVVITMEIKPGISLLDAIKLRIAGGKQAQKFWLDLTERVVAKFEAQMKQE